MGDERALERTNLPDAGPPAMRRRFLLEAIGLAAILLGAAWLRLWNIDQNGYGNSYYAAAVRSMLASPTNFFFGSFDPAGFITVDKPPGAVWIQAASVALFGYSGRSLLIPQALMGVASVLVTYLLVRRVAGPGAAFLAGLIVATTPVSVAVDRDNLPDTALVLLLLLATWAMSRAVETGRYRPLLLAAVWVGVAFNVKMLAAFVVLPTFYLAYLLGAPCRWWGRVGRLAVATVVLATVSLSWVAVVELTPKDRRPYIGGSKENSALELAVGYNGLGRIFGGSGNFGPRGGPRQNGPPPGRPDGRRAGGLAAGPGSTGELRLAPGARPVNQADDNGAGQPVDGDGPPPGFPLGPPSEAGGGPPFAFSPGPPPEAGGGVPPFPRDGPAGGFRAGAWIRDQAPPVINSWSLVAQAQSSQAIAVGPAPYLLGVAQLAMAVPPRSPRPGGPWDRGPLGPPGPGPGGPPGQRGFGGAPGPWRFAGAQLAGQITWLVPLALVGALAAWRFRWGTPADPAAVAVFLWGGSLLTHLVVFSWAQGIFHEYYTTVMAPAVASLAGIGVAALWGRWFHGGGWRGLLLLAALALTAAWQVFIVWNNYPNARRWLLPTVLVGVGIALVAMLGLRWFARYRWLGRIAKGAAGVGLAALLVGPTSWALAVLARPGNAVMPAAPEPSLFSDRPDRGSPMRPPFDVGISRDSRLVDFLRANRREERFLVMAPSVGAVAPIIIATGEPAVALGGFLGADPVVTKDEFARMVEERQVRFVFAGGPGGPPGPPGGGPGGAGMPPPGGGPAAGPGEPPGRQANAEVLAWVREHGKEVDPRLWRGEESANGPRPGGPGRRGGRGGPGGPMERLYDCRPELGLVDPNGH
jgi:4-amino-4-deoxy-L-arabinose transferase-like glycosyltransferase